MPGEAGVAEHSGRDMCSLNLCGGAHWTFRRQSNNIWAGLSIQ